MSSDCSFWRVFYLVAALISPMRGLVCPLLVVLHICLDCYLFVCAWFLTASSASAFFFLFSLCSVATLSFCKGGSEHMHAQHIQGYIAVTLVCLTKQCEHLLEVR